MPRLNIRPVRQQQWLEPWASRLGIRMGLRDVRYVCVRGGVGVRRPTTATSATVVAASFGLLMLGVIFCYSIFLLWPRPTRHHQLHDIGIYGVSTLDRVDFDIISFIGFAC